MTDYICTLNYDDTVRLRHATGLNRLDIAFKRTVRVSDNGKANTLPPDLGNFPLFKVNDYANTLPAAMVAKGGLFMPMYQREAMWINFNAEEPFLIKIYAGGVNIVSGENAEETSATTQRRRTRREEKKSVQDYMVAPNQKWVDGIATKPGLVRQFVAMPMGEGYSVEAQLTGKESQGGLQFEITPAHYVKPDPTRCDIPDGETQIFVRTLNGKTLALMVNLWEDVRTLKLRIRQKEGLLPMQQKLICRGIRLEDDRDLADYDIAKHSTLHLLVNLPGGAAATETSRAEMSIAAGGLIKQTIVDDARASYTWNQELTTVFNVQILNSAAFRMVTGFDPPESPVTAQSYTDRGLKFFEMWEEPSEVHGQFDLVKSVAKIDNIVEPELPIENILLASDGTRVDESPDESRPADKLSARVEDFDGFLSTDGPLRDFRTVGDLCKDLDGMTLASTESEKTLTKAEGFRIVGGKSKAKATAGVGTNGTEPGKKQSKCILFRMKRRWQRSKQSKTQTEMSEKQQ